MSAYTVAAAMIERGTAIHRHTSARILSIYLETSEADGLGDNGFPVSGDMLAVLKRDTDARAQRRRRRAAHAASWWETTQ